MAVEIVLPKFGNTVEECILKSWNKKVGDTVDVDEVLCEVETDKTTMDVNSTSKGVVRHVFYEEGDVVSVMEVIAIVGNVDEDISSFISNTQVNSKSTSVEGDEKAVEIKKQGDVNDAKTNNKSDRAKISNDEFTFTPRAKKYLKEKGISVQDFVLCFPIHTFSQKDTGVIEERDVKHFFDSIASISPTAIDLLVKQKKFLSIKKGSGIGGRIIEQDIHSLSVATNDSTNNASSLQGMQNVKELQRTQMKGMRKIISDRMLHSVQTSAPVTLHMAADASNIKNVREKYKQAKKAITINDIVLYIVSRVLQNNTWANSLLVDNAIIEYCDVNLGCAVQTKNGLMVPVITKSSEKSIESISSEIKQLSEKCHSAKIDPIHLQGGTFTVSNLGSFGVQAFTPILNVPQTGILGVGGIDFQAIQNSQGDIEFKQHIHLSLTFDHRAYDGADGANLLKAFAEAIAQFNIEKV